MGQGPGLISASPGSALSWLPGPLAHSIQREGPLATEALTGVWWKLRSCAEDRDSRVRCPHRLPRHQGLSSAGAGGGGEDDNTRRTPGSGRSWDGAPRSGGPPPVPPAPGGWMARPGPGDPARAPPPGAVTAQVCEVPHGSARGRPGAEAGRGGAEAGSRARAAARRSRPAGLRLRSEGRMRGRGIRTQGRRTLGRAGFRGLNAPGFGVERSQAPERLGCRPPGPSPRPPFPPAPASWEGAAPGSRVGRVSGPWASATQGCGEDT
ncbi:translation initiation factor IF-2-like isoform X2 [Zalophus californianus]|uniref:Translation initiation factor IF-2-like isoform X2 n=1 Tax=Zalophus californianus TaxID=9704 RepID=A0A6J2EVG6_ZALCA|nr:translation initiation factor IF-2-like isoform X2 [Zalophus californianus]